VNGRRGRVPPEERDEVAGWLIDARGRTLALVRDLPVSARLGARHPLLNPPLWELGHVGWFEERWLLREEAGRLPRRDDADALYDSSAVPHDVRWELPLPSWEETLRDLVAIEESALQAVGRGDVRPYFARLAALHEEMHAEAFVMARQLLGLPAPAVDAAPPPGGGPLPGDVPVPGGSFTLGAPAGEPFAFDNELPPWTVALAPFAIARAPVTQAELARFVEDGGYRRPELWTEAGWAWRRDAGADAPWAWRRAGAGWERRHFDRWVALEPHRPAVHVCAHEADAYCRWAGRRLPTEAEWEAAALGEPAGGALAPAKRRWPWGDAPPTPAHAGLDHRTDGPADVGACAAGDSAFGCRQLAGGVWEWTASSLEPFPGFTPGPYRDYSRPWFGTHRVLRGGSFATSARVARPTYRNFYTPDRRDPFAGFRTCPA
jgi:iron(II)-dependent oxidoreductase